MKNIINILIVLTLTLGFTSCKKEKMYEPENPQTTTPFPANVSPIGSTWELYSGRVFEHNTTTGTDVYFDHFGPSRNNSNLDVFASSTLPIDNITKGVTTWKFTSSNQFILNGGNTYSYNVNTNGIFNVYGLENGSSRPIEVLNSTADYMNIKIYESNGNNGTDNYNFYTILTFVKVGSTVTPEEYSIPNGTSYGGVLSTTPPATQTLTGTKWVVTQYVAVGSSVYSSPNDTLNFISSTQYTINSSAPRNYSLSSVVGSTMKSLSLYSFTTLGGDWSGNVQGTFMTDGQIWNSTFTNLFTTSSQMRVWIIKQP